MPDSQNPTDPKSQGAGAEGDKVRLYAGKYKSPEELEAGYKELEKGYHETRQEIGELRRVVEARLPEPRDDGYGQGGQYAPVAQPSQASEVLTRFYQNPEEVLRSVQQSAVAEAEKRILGKQQREAELRGRLAAWESKNPDVAQYRDLLDFYVRQTDGRLAPETRLDDAAKRVRERLVELRGTREANPGPQDYIPGPSGNRDGVGARQQSAPPSEPSPEAALSAYVAERSQGRVKRLGGRK